MYVNSKPQKLAVWFKANKMAVNVNKTNYIIFWTRGKIINADLPDLVFNSDDPNSNDPDSPDQCPQSIYKLDRIHDNNPDIKLRNFKPLGVFFLQTFIL